MTQAKARAIGVLVEAADCLRICTEMAACVIEDFNRGEPNRLLALDAIAELLSPSPEPANFYEYRV